MTNGTRKGWGVSATPRLLFTSGKDPVPIVQEAGWAPGPVWTGAENLAPTGIRSPDRPARSQSLYWLSYRAHYRTITNYLTEVDLYKNFMSLKWVKSLHMTITQYLAQIKIHYILMYLMEKLFRRKPTYPLPFLCFHCASSYSSVESSWNVMAHGDAWERKWRGNWQMEWVASTLHTTSEHGVSSITTTDAHTSVVSSRLNWQPRRCKGTCPFYWKTKSGFCAYAITFQTQSNTVVCDSILGPMKMCLFYTHIFMQRDKHKPASVAMMLLMLGHLLLDQNLGSHWAATSGTDLLISAKHI